MVAIKKEISLLPESENVNSLSSRILKWAANAGRFIIVFTELIVVIAFISRFWLDRKNADLSEVIRQQKAIISSTREFESLFINTQKKLTDINTFYNNLPNYKDKINTIIQSAPPDVSFSSLTLKTDEKTKKIVASAVSQAFLESSIVSFLSNLTINPSISSLNVSSIEKKPRENKYTIIFDLTYKEATATNSAKQVVTK